MMPTKEKSLVEPLLAELSAFEGREKSLRGIYRWKQRKPMWYRPHVYSHSKKVAWMVEQVMPIVVTILDNFDPKRATALALVHDDPEIITGDYEAGNKAKMAPEQLAVIDAEERAAIIELSRRFPATFGGFNYQELQEDIQDLLTQEARVAKYLDVLDGFCEGVHELYAGNPQFTRTLINEFGTIPPFGSLNIERRAAMMEKYPELRALKDAHVFFEIHPELDWQTIVSSGVPHTRDSLEKATGYPQYDLWKEIILNSRDQEEIKNLYIQKEFN